jgi:tetratricopeptide (TPR) repeat protein
MKNPIFSYLKAYAMKKQDREDHKGRGDRLRDARYWAEAAEAYKQYLIQNPDDFAIWVQCGNCLKDAGDFSGSLQAYSQAIRLDPADADVYLQMGHLAKLNGAIEEARNYYLHSLSLDPEKEDAQREVELLPPAATGDLRRSDGLTRGGGGAASSLRMGSSKNDESSAILSERLSRFKADFAKLNS